MNDFDRQPGAIDDPGLKGGIEPEEQTLPPGDTADNTGGPGEPSAAELDLPGPDDPVAWGYVEPDTPVVDGAGQRIGRVALMLGTDEGIFHGIAVKPERGGETRVVPADAVTRLTSSSVEVAWSAEQLASGEEYQPVPG
jgi:hypothetical protein